MTTYFNTKDGVILSQTDGTNTWYFQYDTNGTPLGFVLNGTQYFYITNQMGDVLAITDTNGDIVGNYEYDAWGKVLTADTDIAKQNPIRYRGYYYDNETGYYYLQSRYYDSNICRFINADIFGEVQLSFYSGVISNLFGYCKNSPNNYTDKAGTYNSAAAKMTGLGFCVTSLLVALIGSIPTSWIICGIIITAATITVLYYSEHRKNKRKSTYDKHTKKRPGRSSEKKKQKKGWKQRK